MEGDLNNDKELEKALKKFRKATEVKMKMNESGKPAERPQSKQSEHSNKKTDEDKGMSHNEYMNLKQSLQSKLKNMVPVSYEMLDYRIDQIENRLAREKE